MKRNSRASRSNTTYEDLSESKGQHFEEAIQDTSSCSVHFPKGFVQLLMSFCLPWTVSLLLSVEVEEEKIATTSHSNPARCFPTKGAAK